MQAKRILNFLRQVAANNNRDWFANHKNEYLACKEDFEMGVEKAIQRIALFDSHVASQKAKDCCYRFYRDTRFSEDKSPYKRHFGAYICERGRKSLRAGYYLHLQPGHSFISCGSYWLPTNILTACRNELMANIDEWRKCVENGQFIKYFGYPGNGSLDMEEEFSEKGFGISMLKTCPKDFPRDYEFIQYLRMKDYAVWHRVDDDFFKGDGWLEDIDRMFRVAQPLNHFLNAVIADYD